MTDITDITDVVARLAEMAAHVALAVQRHACITDITDVLDVVSTWAAITVLSVQAGHGKTALAEMAVLASKAAWAVVEVQTPPVALVTETAKAA